MIRKIILLTLFTAMAGAQENAQSLFDCMQDVITVENSQAVMIQRIQTTSGSIRELTYDSYSAREGEVSMLRYVSPARVRGNALLMTDDADNIWMYNKRSNRVRKLASHAKKQKFEGSDFTYEDMGSGNSWEEKYTPELGGEATVAGIECQELILRAKTGDASYSRIVCWPRKSDCFPVQIDYYDENGTHTKSLFMQDIRDVEGIPTPMKMVMKNELDNTRTEMEYQSVTYDVTFPDDFFTERNLKK